MAFLFFRRRRILRFVQDSAPTLRRRIADMSLPERCATLALGSATLLSVGRHRRLPLAQAPHRLGEEPAVEAIEYLVEGRRQALDRLEALGDEISIDVANQAVRQIVAMEVVAVTVSLSLDASRSRLVRGVWTDLLAGRRARKGAMELLVRYASATRTSPLPLVDGKSWRTSDVEALLSVPPPFLGAGRKPVRGTASA